MAADFVDKPARCRRSLVWSALLSELGFVARFFDGGDDVFRFGRAIVGGAVGHGDLRVFDSFDAFKCGPHIFDTGEKYGLE